MKGGGFGEPQEGFPHHLSGVFSLLKIRHRRQGEMSEKIGREEMYICVKLWCLLASMQTGQEKIMDSI